MKEQTYLFTNLSPQANARDALALWQQHPTYRLYQSLRGGCAVVPPSYDDVFAVFRWRRISPTKLTIVGEASEEEKQETEHHREPGDGRKGTAGVRLSDWQRQNLQEVIDALERRVQADAGATGEELAAWAIQLRKSVPSWS